ncbi:hypothetical protein MMC11_002526 [Xylographa trunciseda]|nr:hypothetical protein [Xylographa trunciseda]
MAGTRSSARLANSSSPNSSQGNAPSTPGRAGSKRKAEATPGSKAKRGKKGSEKQQKTIEETLPAKDEDEMMEDEKLTDEKATEPKLGPGMDEGGIDELDPKGGADTAREEGEEEKTEKKEEDQVAPANEQANGIDTQKEELAETNGNGETSTMDATGKLEPPKSEKTEHESTNKIGGDAVEESSQREASTPSSILEKGIIYFFFRGRVNIDDPSNVDDLARSYIVLRPLPHGAKLGDGPIGDDGNNRILALPKKVLPVSPKDRFMVFVEQAKSSMEDIKKNHLTPSDYATKTAGTRHTPAATPVAEGVYAITTTGRESHLAYIVTIPSELSEVQRDVGLSERGSFVTSIKNPQYPGPANTNLPKGPEFPQEFIDEFRSLRWMPLQPKFLDYKNCQILLIGSGTEDLSKATDQTKSDAKANEDTPLEEMEKLEHEDEIRVEHLKGIFLIPFTGKPHGSVNKIFAGDDSVFEDLGLSSKEYSKIPTTW